MTNSIHNMNLNPSPFEMIKSGKKTIELRLFDEKRQQIKNLYKFDTFEKLYKTLPLLKCGYTPDTICNAHFSDMQEYYSVEEQEKYGVIGIELCLI